jgi:hypothetical protein
MTTSRAMVLAWPLARIVAWGLLVTTMPLRAGAQPPSPEPVIRVIDARTGVPVADARITCDGQAVALTDAAGAAHGIVCHGRVDVSAEGYVSAVFDGPLGAQQDVRLEPAATGAVTPSPYEETVDVEGQVTPPLDAGVPAQFAVTAADLEPFRGALLDDPLRAMQAMPGVATTDELRADLSVRGSPFRQVGIVMDDVKSQLLMHTVRGVEQTGSVALLNGDMVASASLSAGSYPQRFGNSLGAELVVRTKDGRDDRMRGRLMTSAIATTATLDGPLAGSRVTWMLAARRSYASWIVRRVDPDVSGTFDFQDAHGKLRAQLGQRQHVSFTWLGGASTYDEHGRRTSAFAIDKGRNRTHLLSAHWQATPSSTLLVSQRVSYVSARFRNTNPDGRELDEGRDRELLARTSLTWTGPGVTVEAGGIAERYRLNGTAVRFGGTESGQARAFSGRTGRAGGHLHVQTRPVAAVRLSGGLRVDQVDGIGVAASPWVQVGVALGSHWQLQAAHGVHRQAPDLLQRAGPNAGTGLAMERARHTDAGVSWQAGAWSVALAAYDRRERDVLDTPARDARLAADGTLVPGNPRAPWTNALDGNARGLELVVRYGARRGTGWVSYARSRVRQTSLMDASAFPSAFEQTDMFTAAGSLRLSERWDASTTLRLASNWPYDGYFEARDGRTFLSERRNGLRLPAYARVDLRIRRTVPIGTRRLVLFAEAINLFNRRNIRQVEGSYDSRTLEVFRISERQLPIIPSVGLAFEF